MARTNHLTAAFQERGQAEGAQMPPHRHTPDRYPQRLWVSGRMGEQDTQSLLSTFSHSLSISRRPGVRLCPDSGSCPQSGERDRGLEPTVDSGAQLSRAPRQALNACVWGVGWQGGHQGTRQRQTQPAPRPTCPWPLSPRVSGGGFLERPPAAFPWEPWGGQWVSTASLAASPQHWTNQPQRQSAEWSRG